MTLLLFLKRVCGFATFIFCILWRSVLLAQYTPDTLQYLHNTGVTGTQWAFTVAHITDIHLGEDSPNGDYGTVGWNDTIDATTGCAATERLRRVVNWINTNKTSEKIAFVFVGGDISDRGEKSGFIMARQILDSLAVPYVISNGNHDMWPRTSGGDEAPRPFGDSVFAQVFAAHFTSLSQQMSQWDDGTRLTRVFNPINGIYSQFQNFAFSYGSYRFIVSDFATRFRKPLGVGTSTDAELYDIPGGTYPWLMQSVANAQTTISDGVILMQHFPIDGEILSSTYSFDSDEYDSLMDILEPAAQNFGLCIAGHRHRNKTYTIKRSTFSSAIATGVETDANADYPNGLVRLVRFWDYPTASIKSQDEEDIKLFPNPTQESVTLNIPPYLIKPSSHIAIFDSRGQEVLSLQNISEQNILLGAELFSKGLYFVKINNGISCYVLKLTVL